MSSSANIYFGWIWGCSTETPNNRLPHNFVYIEYEIHFVDGVSRVYLQLSVCLDGVVTNACKICMTFTWNISVDYCYYAFAVCVCGRQYGMGQWKKIEKKWINIGSTWFPCQIVSSSQRLCDIATTSYKNDTRPTPVVYVRMTALSFSMDNVLASCEVKRGPLCTQGQCPYKFQMFIHWSFVSCSQYVHWPSNWEEKRLTILYTHECISITSCNLAHHATHSNCLGMSISFKRMCHIKRTKESRRQIQQTFSRINIQRNATFESRRPYRGIFYRVHAHWLDNE